MGSYKAAGPDGIPAIFYKKFWHIVGEDVIAFIKTTFKEKKFDSTLNKVLLCLIPKQTKPETMAHFRPIALCNVLIKTVSKVIANRLKRVLPNLISGTQCSFVPGRQGIDNVIIVQEMLHTMKMKKGKKGYMVIKLDLEKAYDRVNLDFLAIILKQSGLSMEFIQLILYCLKSSALQVLWVANPLDEIKPTRGLRQGDPLAPYLFVLCMEALSHLIRQQINQGNWKEIKVTRKGPNISHVMFADDLILFGEANETQGQVMQQTLQCFCGWSGQKINTNKSRVYFSPNTPKHLRQILSQMFDIPETAVLGKYLGIPIHQKRITKDTFQDVVDKVKTKLAAWKMKTMTRATRLVLIQSVTSTIPAYAMQVAKIPEKNLREIEKLNRNFLWGDTEANKKNPSCRLGDSLQTQVPRRPWPQETETNKLSPVG